MRGITVFAALGWERRAATAALAAVVPGERARTWRGRLGDGTPCLVVETGVGPERAERAAAAAPPSDAFVVCGCAGALVPGLRAGEVVVAEAVVPLDGAGRAGTPLPAHAGAVAAWGARHGMALRVGPIASSAAVLGTLEAKRAAGASGALVVEMESAPLAAAAAARRIPFVGLRVVLDEMGEALPLPPGEPHPARLARALALRPWLWPAAVRLARRARLAERRLAAALYSLLGAGGTEALLGASPVACAGAG